jgi:hypothetical protein
MTQLILSNVDKDTKNFLQSLFPDAEPFGPTSAERFDPTAPHERRALETLFTTHGEVLARLALRPRVLFGRRGSGKTYALMHSLCSVTPSTVGAAGGTSASQYDIIVFRSQQQQWRKVCSAVTRRFEKQPAASVEEVAEIWRDAVRTLIIHEWARSAIANRANDEVLKILPALTGRGDGAGAGLTQRVIRDFTGLADAIFGTSVQDELDEVFRAFGELKDAVTVFWDVFEAHVFRAHEERKPLRCAVRLNSSEQYNFSDNPTVVSGFLRFIAAPELDAAGQIDLQIALPTEHVQSFEMLSTSPLADFTNRVFLQWCADGLLELAARRCAVFWELLDHEDRPDWEVDATSVAGSIELLGRVVGVKPVAVDGGGQEPRLQYLLRHTHMLPRQFLSLLNNLVDGRRIRDGVAVDEEQLRRVMSATSTLICSDIFRGFKSRWIVARPVCEAILPDLPQVFSLSDLENAIKAAPLMRRVERHLHQFGEKYEVPYDLDCETVRDMLVEIGAAGRVTTERRRDSSSPNEVLGEFDYTHPSRLYLHRTERMCVHPAFATHYNSPLPGGTATLVLPLGSMLPQKS